MKTEIQTPSHSAPVAPTTQNAQPVRPETPRLLSPGEWIRVVHGVTAPFGHDRMPTIFG